MNNVCIPRVEEVYKEYLLTNPNILNKNKRQRLCKGGKPQKILYKFENINFLIYYVKSPISYDISIKRDDNIELQDCLHIVIKKDDKENNIDKVAYIENISYYEDCVKIGLKHPGGGGVLLRLAIQFLKEHKNEFDINKIQLTDSSTFYCKDLNGSLQLPVLYTLLYGDTWYGKYGFTPYNSLKNKPSKSLLKKYNKNKEIVTSVKIKDSYLWDYFVDIIYKNESDDKKSKLSEKFKKKYGELYIYQFFQIYMKNFDLICKNLSKFYIKFAEINNLTNFSGKSFYLDI
jgi:hypothetical protein